MHILFLWWSTRMIACCMQCIVTRLFIVPFSLVCHSEIEVLLCPDLYREEAIRKNWHLGWWDLKVGSQSVTATNNLVFLILSPCVLNCHPEQQDTLTNHLEGRNLVRNCLQGASGYNVMGIMYNQGKLSLSAELCHYTSSGWPFPSLTFRTELSFWLWLLFWSLEK